MTKKDSTKVVLLDSHAILHRAYHALPDFSSSKGEPTGALYGLSTMLIKIITELKPDHIIAAYDLPKPTYRHEAYKEYKAGRKKTDEELISQIIRSRDIFHAFGIPIYDKEGFEADDVVGTIVQELKPEKNVDVVIASGDMDTLQLVDGEKVRVYTLKKGIKDTIIYDEKGVVARYGFLPELLPDYKGLRGDPSDNIIGIKGIGDKTASILIQKFGTIENMYKELKHDKEQFKKAGLTDRIVKLLEDNKEEAEFSKMLATIRRDAPINFKLPEKSWKDAVESDKILALFNELEFRSLGARVREICGVTEDKEEEQEKIKQQENIDPRILKETAIAVWLVDSNISYPGLEEILQFAKTDSFSEAREIILGELEKRNVKKVFLDIELPLVPIIERMEKRGIKVDTKYLEKLSKEYHSELSKIEKKIYRHAGEEFNINSPKQLGVVLFEKMGLKAKNQKKTAGGAMSTRESELEKLRELHPIIEEIMNYRELQKLLSTYIDTIPHLVAKDGRLHTTLHQAGTTTGRMASLDPNLQNIPIKSELGRNIRNAFVAEKGYKIVSFDYSQIELRVAAFLSKDEKLIDIFKSGRDVHTEVAAEVFGVPADKVDKGMRAKAKTINFGILYGMGVNALKQNLKTSREEAQIFYNEYFKTFSRLASYLEETKASAARKGYTETFFGRRRYFEGINSKLPFIKAMAERMAINAPIQGTGADILKIALRKIDEYIIKEGLEHEAYPLLQIHDELLYEVKEDVVKNFSREVKKIMEGAIDPKDIFGIVLETNCAAGDSWGDMHEA